MATMEEQDGTTAPIPQKVTKIEGAERLLKTAILLFFEERDLLAIHGLVAGAHEVIYTLLAKNNQATSFIRNNDYIRPEYAREYHEHMNRPQNFLKHADRDPDGILDFYEKGTPMWIFDAIGMYAKLTGSLKHREFFLFFVWFSHEYPQLLKKGPLLDMVNKFNARHSVSKNTLAEIIRRPWLIDTPGFV